MRLLARGALLLPLLAVACATGGGAPAAIADLDGELHTPLAPARAASVLIFITTDCPISNTYAPEISAIAGDYRDRPVDFYLVHVDPEVDAEAARAHASDFGLPAAILLDPGHELVEAVGATITPEAAVIARGGGLAYRGRIDNWYGDLGAKRPAPTRHELREAIDAVLAGVAVPEPRTEAVGCYIPQVF